MGSLLHQWGWVLDGGPFRTSGGGFWRGSISHQQGVGFEGDPFRGSAGGGGVGMGSISTWGPISDWGVHFGPAGGGFWDGFHFNLGGPFQTSRWWILKGVHFGLGGPFRASGGGWVLEGGPFQPEGSISGQKGGF